LGTVLTVTKLARTGHGTRRRAALVVLLALGAVAATAQERAATSAPAEPSWSLGASGAWYALPDETDFVQPTLRADHGRLHLEARYNYEDRASTSLFAGATFEIGEKTKLALTPMLGGLAGRTDGVVPGLEADLTAGPFAAYAEAEYVFDLGDSSSSYFYMWSELSVWPTSWLRAGVVTQRTHVYRTDRDIQRGLLAGLAIGRVEATAYLFNPDADDRFTVVSLGVSF
jgi:hypothetical protein